MVVAIIKRLMDDKNIAVIKISDVVPLDTIQEYCCGLFDKETLHFESYSVPHDNGTTKKLDYAIMYDGSMIGIVEFHVSITL